MPDFIVYSKESCPACLKAFEMLQLYGKTFKIVKLGVDITIEDFKESFPTIRTVPVITHKARTFTSVVRLGTYLRGEE